MYKIDPDDESHTENDIRRTIIMNRSNRGMQRNNAIPETMDEMHNDFMHDHMNIHDMERNRNNNTHALESRLSRLEQQVASGKEEFVKLRKSVEIYQILSNNLILIDIDKDGNDGHSYMSRFLDVFNYIVDYYKMSHDKEQSPFIHFIEINDYETLKISKITYEETTNPVTFVVSRKLSNMGRNFYIEVMFLKYQTDPDTNSDGVISGIYQLSIYSKTLDVNLLKEMLSQCITRSCPYIETFINKKTNGVTIRLNVEGSVVCELLIYLIRFINRMTSEIFSTDFDDLEIDRGFFEDVFASKELDELNKDFLDQREASDIDKAIALSMKATKIHANEVKYEESELVAEAIAEGTAEECTNEDGNGEGDEDSILLHATCLPGNFDLENMFHITEQRSSHNNFVRGEARGGARGEARGEATITTPHESMAHESMAHESMAHESVYRTINIDNMPSDNDNNEEGSDDDDNLQYSVEEVDLDDICDEEVVEIDGNSVVIDGNTITIDVTDENIEENAEDDESDKGWGERKLNAPEA